ncbi:tryptophan synthase subunit alpha [Natronobacterium gregoryi]|uniref:Tryptophan synthase alpha chain n=2 Tax=Natronobacterium gregoryi TaxID=44930 RepID=L0AEZ5_NATGS|nr:tryptophan synthase subunit alpha [Natronobacterium gregoryi]AFZ72004.1 tryptophan synthase, alpha subunit [Natronobacterium gregoryi SP2]ELY62720.1 tryptophan synthase subunit alpha [Natronobacterium gregoryi SP2]PLK20856.1 tryptophan synthase subunit alpha [Natronobacterium gregoryi SP2]SFJ19830.1 tryptophan synthase, alpha chain [Natronobacterium gregoryi]
MTSDSDVEAAIRENHPALITYITAGDPSLEDTKAYVEALDRGGSDLIELGLPFSEPIAEGPTIQAAINRALEAGTTPAGFFELVDDLETEAPLLVMTYYNMILQYGGSEAPRASDGRAAKPRDEPDVRPFVERAAAAGLSGIIVPDLPAEEADPLREACDDHGLDLVFIVAPTTEGERLERIMSQVSGFAYVQARLGTTGARANVSSATHDSLARLSEYDVPKAVGFGVSEGDHAAEIIEAGADGVIVGSALVELIGEHGEGDAPAATALEATAAELKRGVLRGGGFDPDAARDGNVPEPEQP